MQNGQTISHIFLVFAYILRQFSINVDNYVEVPICGRILEYLKSLPNKRRKLDR